MPLRINSLADGALCLEKAQRTGHRIALLLCEFDHVLKGALKK
jgi:hypothetical protein